MIRSLPKFQPAARELPRNLPIVAIVGRPNVGKSTFFNRLVGERRAIVDDLPGVTRDRNYAETVWAGRRFLLVDTGGLESATAGKLEEDVQAQSHLAVAESDVIMFLLDGKGGLNPLDEEAVGWLRQTEKPVFFAVNKLDSRQRENNLYEFYALGLDKLYSISAEHGLGIPDLMDDVVQHLAPNMDREQDDDATEAAPLRVAIVGRPNVGKSTLTNRLLGFQRSVVDSVPGTTRDAVDTPFNLRGEACVLVDTAGIRRKARIDDRIERYSVSRSLNAVDRGDLIVHIIDGPENVTDQDAQILSYAVQRGKAILLVVNKWDLVRETGGDPDKYRDEIKYRLSFLEYVPISFISAATGLGIRKMLETAARVVQAYRRKVSTSALNQALQEIVQAHTVPLFRSRPVKFYYGTQTGIAPPTFTFFVNQPDGILESYQRYLVNQLRQRLGFVNAPIRLHFRARREATQGRRKGNSPGRSRSA